MKTKKLLLISTLAFVSCCANSYADKSDKAQSFIIAANEKGIHSKSTEAIKEDDDAVEGEGKIDPNEPPNRGFFKGTGQKQRTFVGFTTRTDLTLGTVITVRSIDLKRVKLGTDERGKPIMGMGFAKENGTSDETRNFLKQKNGRYYNDITANPLIKTEYWFDQERKLPTEAQSYWKKKTSKLETEGVKNYGKIEGFMKKLFKAELAPADDPFTPHSMQRTGFYSETRQPITVVDNLTLLKPGVKHTLVKPMEYQVRTTQNGDVISSSGLMSTELAKRDLTDRYQGTVVCNGVEVNLKDAKIRETFMRDHPIAAAMLTQNQGLYAVGTKAFSNREAEKKALKMSRQDIPREEGLEIQKLELSFKDNVNIVETSETVRVNFIRTDAFTNDSKRGRFVGSVDSHTLLFDKQTNKVKQYDERVSFTDSKEAEIKGKAAELYQGINNVIKEGRSLEEVEKSLIDIRKNEMKTYKIEEVKPRLIDEALWGHELRVGNKDAESDPTWK